MFDAQNGNVRYKDDQVQVMTEVDPHNDAIDFNYHRSLNCIKITAFTENPHFIQFCTRLYPNLFKYRMTNGEIMEWEKIQDFYMEDTIDPKWKLDVGEDSSTCFYEEEGFCKRELNCVSMYDDPSGSFPISEERAIFCTFVLIENKITHVVKWSKEYILVDEDVLPNYTVDVETWKNKPLPLWAVNILNQYYKSKETEIQTELCSKALISEAEITSSKFISEQSKNFFLIPPANWYTLLTYPNFFPKSFSVEDEENEKEKVILMRFHK